MREKITNSDNSEQMLTLNGGPRSVSTSSNPLIVWRASDHYSRETQAILPPRTFNWDLWSPIRFIIRCLWDDCTRQLIQKLRNFVWKILKSSQRFWGEHQVSFYLFTNTFFGICCSSSVPHFIWKRLTLATDICFRPWNLMKLWSRQYFNEISYICLLICESYIHVSI